MKCLYDTSQSFPFSLEITKLFDVVMSINCAPLSVYGGLAVDLAERLFHMTKDQGPRQLRLTLPAFSSN